jgi:hypothetical protein
LKELVRIKGNLQVPENLLQIINAISEGQKSKDNSGFLAGFNRLIDPAIITMFYGLYKSQELPPIDEEDAKLQASYEFNVDLDPYDNMFNHYLFCLWLNKNGRPEKSKDIMKYREDLYYFISKILDPDIYKNVVIPFYLSKADESEGSETSFLYRLWNSDSIGMTLQDFSPEYLAREFSSAQNDFTKNVIVPLCKKNSQKTLG